MSALFLPALPFLLVALILGIAGIVVRKKQRREATRNVTKWATLVVVTGIVFTGLLVALFTHLAATPW